MIHLRFDLGSIKNATITQPELRNHITKGLSELGIPSSRGDRWPESPPRTRRALGNNSISGAKSNWLIPSFLRSLGESRSLALHSQSPDKQQRECCRLPLSPARRRLRCFRKIEKSVNVVLRHYAFVDQSRLRLFLSQMAENP
jgi:hypothetical protein